MFLGCDSCVLFLFEALCLGSGGFFSESNGLSFSGSGFLG